MNNQHSSSDLYSISSVDQDPNFDQDSHRPQGHPPSPRFASFDSFSIPTPHTHSASFLDHHQLLAPVFYDPPLDLPLDIPQPTVSSTNQHTYETATPFGFPSYFPYPSLPAATVDTWINDGPGSSDMRQSQVLASGTNPDPLMALPNASSGSMSSGSPLDSETIGLFGLSNIFSPFNTSLPLDHDTRSSLEASSPSSREHYGYSPPTSFAILPPSVPVVDLSSSSAPVRQRTQAQYPRRRQSFPQRRTPAGYNYYDDEPKPSTSASPEGRRQQSSNHPSTSGYSVLEFDLTSPQSSVTDLEGTSTMGRMSLPPADDSSPHCLHDKKTQKQPRHWQYNCEYNPNRRRVPCKDPKCNDTFSGKWHMERHWDKRHKPGGGGGSG